VVERGRLLSMRPIAGEKLKMDGVIPLATNAARSIFVIPGGTLLSGFDFLVTRLR